MKLFAVVTGLLFSGAAYSWTNCSQRALVLCNETDEVFQISCEASGKSQSSALVKLDEKMLKRASSSCGHTPAWETVKASKIKCVTIEDDSDLDF